MSSFLLPDDIRKAFQRLGSKGGSKTKARLGSAHYRRIGKLGMASRWGKKRKQATCSPSL